MNSSSGFKTQTLSESKRKRTKTVKQPSVTSNKNPVVETSSPITTLTDLDNTSYQRLAAERRKLEREALEARVAELETQLAEAQQRDYKVLFNNFVREAELLRDDLIRLGRLTFEAGQALRNHWNKRTYLLG